MSNRISKLLTGVLLGLNGMTAFASDKAATQSFYGTLEPFTEHAVYFVLTDRFVNGDVSNDQRNQGGALHTFDRKFYGPDNDTANIGYLGGDFRGLLNNAKYIRDMGFGAVWLTPIIDNPDEAFSGGDPIQWGGILVDQGKTGYHGYWGVNFFELDEHLPSKGLDFAGLTRGLKEKGLKTVLDIVINHGSPGFTMTHRQPKFGQIYDKNGKLIADHENLPPEKLDPVNNPLHRFFFNKKDLAQLTNNNDESDMVLDYFVEAYLQWIDQGADAFRVDTVRHVGLPFWQKFNQRIRDKHPGFFMFGEVFDEHGKPENIAKYTWNENGRMSVLDFAMRKVLQEMVEKTGVSYQLLDKTLALTSQVYQNPYELMTFYDNHDMPRVNASDEGFINLHNWLFTARGVPIIYQGSEIGFRRGRAEHAGNRDYFGQKRIDRAPSHRIHQALSQIARVRAATPALQKGLQLNLELAQDRAAFYRVYQHDGVAQTALVMLNKGQQPAEFSIRRDLQQGNWKSAITGKTVTVSKAGTLKASVPANGVEVFVRDGQIEDAALKEQLSALMAKAERR